MYTKGTFVLTDSNCQLGLFDEELELVLVLVLVLVLLFVLFGYKFMAMVRRVW